MKNLGTLPERFSSKVEKTGHCWVWKATKNNLGYGMIWDNAKKRKILAHRAAYMIYRDPDLSDDICVLHQCDNPICVNPEHMFLGTKKQNTRDMLAKMRHAKGEELPQTKLTEEQVLQIRLEYATGNISQQKLGDQYGVSQTQIGFIVRKVNWKHI